MTRCRSFAILLALAALPMAATAQTADLSPTLLIESAPSDNPDYRRMVHVYYLAGERVTVAYKAYNRTEFIQAEPTIDPARIAACTRGTATTLAELRAFERREAQTGGQSPERRDFCIRDVSGWDAGGKKIWLDPIFNGMP
ncbi:MAG: hypothetical protein WBF53_15965, partial [Litorimonas sp.]